MIVIPRGQYIVLIPSLLSINWPLNISRYMKYAKMPYASLYAGKMAICEK